jgi:hypothetical protein
MRLFLILLLTLNLLQAKKIALLIGNSDYSFAPLSNPLNDVDGIYQTLKEIGFDISQRDVLKNASQSKMQKALANFSQRAKDAEIALVYFSGHGMQVNNKNYMFPARTTATKPVDLFGLVDLDYFIQSASSAKYGIILVDACRNNPLVKYFQNGRHKGSNAKKGLGQVEPTNGKVVIGFATSAGDTADDGTGKMSPYATALANRLKEKDDIRNILGKVADDVSKKYEQNPIYRANLNSNVCLSGNCKKSNTELSINIRQEMKYEKARKKLLNDGWQTVKMHTTPNGSPKCWKSWESSTSYSCKFEEIDDCSGTGMGFCLMWFSDANNNFLRIRTSGGEPPLATIDLWEKTVDAPMRDSSF